jgi:hypothetical protein
LILLLIPVVRWNDTLPEKVGENPGPLRAAQGKSPSLLKKRSKKRLKIFAAAFPELASPGSEKFFGSFFQKRTAVCRSQCSIRRADIDIKRTE